MASDGRKVLQNLVIDSLSPKVLNILVVPECHIPETTFNAFLMNVEAGIGLSPTYNKHCKLQKLAICTATDILIVTPKHISNKDTCAMIQKKILCDETIGKHAFNLARLATSLYLDRGCTLVTAFDVLSCAKASRHTLGALKYVLGGKLNESILRKFINLEECDKTDDSDLALQAWAVHHASQVPTVKKALATQVPVNTQKLAEKDLKVLATTQRTADRLRVMQEPFYKNDIGDKYLSRGQHWTVQSARYKTRFRVGENQHLVIKLEDSKELIRAKVAKVNGKQSRLKASHKLHPSSKIKSISTYGREDPTNPERACAEFILRCLCNSARLKDSSFIRAIWFPGHNSEAKSNTCLRLPIIPPPGRDLNASQLKAVQAMLTPTPITIIQGPPGSGKTTIAAATVMSVIGYSDTRTVYLAAQSNVAVKNIAEKLADVGFWQFKILVSNDFLFDWHEHLYQKIDENVIRSDQFDNSQLVASRQLGGFRVILCTLSMLSHRKVESTYTSVVPVETIIVDEASQINVGDFLSVFHNFRWTLKKVVFIGDDKQLAPHGSVEIDELQSIFEKRHLRRRALFLDTQYRMPVVIGHFISAQVYSGKLETVHSDHSRKVCRFVEAGGVEEFDNGAYTNKEEARVVLSLAKSYIKLCRSFRIITPYDGQRNYIENQLKMAKLPWENTVFNVDSFQGNEDEHIIISLVRTKKIGFLRSARRSNVMLTRCKKSMVICISWEFMTQKKTLTTLMGKLAAHMGPSAWVPKELVLAGTWDYVQSS